MTCSNANLRDAYEKEKAYRKRIEAKHAKLVEAARAVCDGVTTGDFGFSDDLIEALRKLLENEE
mgnify:CR=1 FL=1